MAGTRTQCTQGHLLRPGLSFCTTCGEPVAPPPRAEQSPGRPPPERSSPPKDPERATWGRVILGGGLLLTGAGVFSWLVARRSAEGFGTSPVLPVVTLLALATALAGFGLILWGAGRAVRGGLLLLLGVVVLGWRIGTSHSSLNTAVILLALAMAIAGAVLLVLSTLRHVASDSCRNGHPINRRGSYCPVCGVSIHRRCRNGHMLRDRDQFCSTCGEPIADDTVIEPGPPTGLPS
jgi:hypothetical protein